ncbi:uncharacterized protein DMAD_05159 [Drosophila madeirensis]|uniref:Uncharacterized protein n=1 Tax=Drosophila madeirensis TaxID=30013 RepID=A0AAU9FLQ9_DROMD
MALLIWCRPINTLHVYKNKPQTALHLPSSTPTSNSCNKDIAFTLRALGHAMWRELQQLPPSPSPYLIQRLG